MSKFLILTDSIGNPRSFPVSEITQLEETYSYIIRNNFKNSTFWQLSYGNVSTEQLFSQAAGYLSNWEPDIIIIHSGIIDSRPEAFTEFQKTVINKLTGRFVFGKIKKYVFHPALIRHRQVYRVSKARFRKTAKKIKLLFGQSKILWLEICVADGYESARPGANKRMEAYNNIIKEIYGKDFVKIKEKILEVDGFNVDNLHWNKSGHRAVADIILDRINAA
ncbi:MAG: SGNH/GDSL hydrolase family protein [Candidatus Scalindua sediminis]|nr:SGNH/GDSL hydrolase family protein [Candidatus Scalindua sediminis]